MNCMYCFVGKRASINVLVANVQSLLVSLPEHICYLL